MKTERGHCGACGQRTAVRDGEAADGRPQYRCLNDRCVQGALGAQPWTSGHDGYAWDTQQRRRS